MIMGAEELNYKVIEKKAFDVLGAAWKRIYGEFMPQRDYRQLDLPTIEKYVDWNEAADDCKVEIMIPVGA
jgi:AraC family transcriptional regulator